MAAQLFYLPFRPALDMNALALPDAKLYFYYTGGTTKAPIYSDSALSVALANPVEADAAGRWPLIYMNDAITYRVVVKDSTDTTLPGHDVDPYLVSIIDAITPDLEDLAAAVAADAGTASTAASTASSAASSASTSASTASTAASTATTAANTATAAASTASTAADEAEASALIAAGAEWDPEGAWLTATAYTVSPRSVVTQDGSSYVCLVDHISGTFSTDLADLKWQLLAAKGVDGLGAGTVTSVAVSGGTTGLTTSGGPITSSGTITLSGTLDLDNGGTGASLTDPGADRIMFWDDSAGQVTWLTAGTNLTVTGTTLDATGGGATTSKATADQTTTSATAVDITNLAFTPAANTVYNFEALVIMKAASAQPAKIGIAWPTGLNTGHAVITNTCDMTLNSGWATNQTNGVEVTNAAAFLSGTMNLGNDTYRMIRVTGIVDAGATPSGAFKLQFASNGTIVATVKSGSHIKYQAV